MYSFLLTNHMENPPLRPPKQVLGVVAPASAPHKSGQLQSGLNALTEDGYQLHWDPGQLSRRGYLSGTDSERAAQFHQTLTHARYLIAVRGGYGSLRILDRIDYSMAKRMPGVLIGYSDITALQLALYACAGWQSISGPVLIEWDSITAAVKEEVKRLIGGQLPHPVKGLTTEREGQAAGVLLGGNLSIIAKMIGSKYLPSLDRKLLFIEDVNEAPYRIDGILTQFKHAGILNGLRGLIVGRFTSDQSKSTEAAVIQAVLDCVAEYSWPVVSGLEYGHISPRRILPIGVSARLTADQNGGTLEVLQPIAERMLL